MGYYTRVLSKRAECLAHVDLTAMLHERCPDTVLSVEDGEPLAWEGLLLSHRDGREIAVIERNVVEEGSLGAEEIAAFVDEIKDGRPASAVPWLTSFLHGVKTIYAFQHLSGTEVRGGDDALRAVREAIWSRGNAILQADGEGFSNEEGYHILWQFSDRVSGPWWMAVLEGGQWKPFEMELGDVRQREAFFQGRIPERE